MLPARFARVAPLKSLRDLFVSLGRDRCSLRLAIFRMDGAHGRN